MKIRNALGIRLSGAFGKSFITSSWKGTNYLRRYSAPRGPPSDLQKEQRRRFAVATDAWKRLSAKEREAWNRRAVGRRMSGYNLFIRKFFAASRAALPAATRTTPRARPERQGPPRASPYRRVKSARKSRTPRGRGR